MDGNRRQATAVDCSYLPLATSPHLTMPPTNDVAV